MNGKEMVEQITMRTGLTKKEVKTVLNAFCSITETAMKKGDSVCILGFGTFGVRKRAARSGRNPRTKEKMDLPEALVPTFKAGKALKVKVNGE